MELNIVSQTQPIVVNRIGGVFALPEQSKSLDLRILEKFDEYKLCCLVDTAYDALIKTMNDSASDIGKDKSQRLVNYLESGESYDHIISKMVEHFEKIIVECYLNTSNIML
ncbi:hypothetical protein M3629_17570 [Paenibacillus polysaccharolyticus]|uniref:hypothetical protein n=1 Tax=Paenibacillus polysaccharolyticus TaxID=582692 RepID=UPI00203A3F11|nr:hypothetical protein [Paenibacillus polysaccharolyticus]MCM3134602.1 hypothetical protein [Paenibacillus polysaccharolyticus]